jgi:hypothetical protein
MQFLGDLRRPSKSRAVTQEVVVAHIVVANRILGATRCNDGGHVCNGTHLRRNT